MAQRVVEIVIGRLISDEQFRRDFLHAPEATLEQLRDRGLELSAVEVSALISTDPAVWLRAANALDDRLQKVAFAQPAAGSREE